MKKKNELKKQIDELQKQIEIEEKAFKERLEAARNEIEEVLTKYDLWAGTIVNGEMASQIVKLAIETGENVLIPFSLYEKPEEIEKK